MKKKFSLSLLAMIVVLLAPGLILQSMGTSPGVFLTWTAGTATGAYLGVASGLFTRSLLPTG